MAQTPKEKEGLMDEKDNRVVLHIDVLALLGLIFIVLKLCGVIDWGWFWVLLPLILSAL